MRKSLSMLLLSLLIFQTMSSSMLIPSNVLAIGTKEESVFSNIKVTDQEGNEVDLEASTDTDTDVTIHIDWSVAGLEVKEAGEETLPLPAELRIDQKQEGTLTGEEESIELGTYQATEDGKVTVHFLETIEEQVEAGGSFSLEATLVQDEPATTEDDGDKDEEVVEEDSSEEKSKEQEEQPTEEPTEEVPEEDQIDSKEEEEPKEEESTDEQKDSDDTDELNKKETTENNEKKVKKRIQPSNVEITENLVTGVTLNKKVPDGEDEVLVSGEPIVVEQPYDGFEVDMTYEFALPNGHEYGDGSTYTIEVPEMFSIPQVPESESHDLLRSDNVAFGSYYTEGNNIIITFNENVENESNIEGNIRLESNFDENYDGLADGDNIIFPIDGQDDLEFPVKFIPNAEVIEKSGIGNKQYNTDTIEWTVEINKNLQEIENATLNDVIGEEDGDHSFIEGSLKVYELAMNADGSVREDEVTDVTDNFESTFSLELGDIDSAYRFVYETEINDLTGETYRNEVTLNGDNTDLSTTEGTVGVTRGQPLEKEASSYDDVSQTITWEVRYNYDEKSIQQDQAKLTDVFGDANQQLVEGSFEIVSIDIDPDTGNTTDGDTVDPSDYNVSDTDTGFELQFNNDIDQAYKIVYETEAMERVETESTVGNTVTDEFDNSQSGSQAITQGVFIKSNGSTNYEAKETNWSILINRDEQSMTDVVVTDTLPAGFTPKNIVVTHDGTTWTDGEDFDYSYDSSNQEMKFNFHQELTKRVDISYTTAIDFDETDDRGSEGYPNIANLKWDHDGEEYQGDRTTTETYNPDDYTQDNGFKHGSYNMETKEITWTIGVNYNNESLEGVAVEDFILGDQNFDIDNVKVYEMGLTGGANGYEIGDDVTADFEVESVTGLNEETGFRATLGNITEAYVIQYTTNLENQHVAATYNNEATVSSSNKDNIVLDATVNPNHGGEYVNKQGQQDDENGRIVNWKLDLNFSQSRVLDYEIVDVLSVNQTIKQETFTVYGTNVSENSISKNDSHELVENEDYTVEFTEDEETGKESFVLTFLNAIDEAYVLEYDSYILYEGDGNYSNSANVSGDIPGDETETVDSVNTNISFNNISGSISGDVGSLQITKVDADDDSVTLEGAVFELWDQAGEELVKTATTDENGVATFTNLLYADYQLKEAEAPEFYVVGIEDQQQITVNADTVADGISIENEKIKQHFELTKVDDVDGTALDGVVFELYEGLPELGTSTGETFTTDAEGKILIEHLSGGNADEGLSAGGYYLVETEPKDHYALDETPIAFTINQDQTVVTEETAGNALTPGSLIFEKVDSESGATLAGAAFNLEYISYNGNEYGTSQTLTTDENGQVEVNDLRPGNYRLTEQTPPRGYEFSSGIDEEFVIEESQMTVVDRGTLTNDVKTTDIVLIKEDSQNSDNKLEGVEFTLTYQGADYTIADQVGVTDENGEITFEDLKPGEYQLTEMAVPSDYGYIADDTPIPVTVTIDDVHEEINVTTTVTNDPFRDVTLTKMDSESGATLAGALFDLYLINADNTETLLEEDLETNNQGAIRITGLAPGDYKFVETKAPNGYTIGQESEFTFTVDGTETSTEPVAIEVENDIITGSVLLTKVDGNNSEEFLEGVIFVLRATELDNVPADSHEEFLAEYNQTLEENYETNIDGEISVDNLRPGEYEFIEIETNDGYQDHWGEIEFTIGFDAEEPNIPVPVEVLNYALVDIPVTKVWEDHYIDEDNDAERPESITVTLLQNEEVHRTQTIDAGSTWTHMFEDLDAVDSNGEKYEYTVSEQTVDGYTSEITGDAENGFEITNTAKTTSLELTKQDSINGQFLSGAEFILTYPDGEETQTGETDENGKMIFEDLQPGGYTLTEETPPTGYIANTTPRNITVTLDDAEQSELVTESIINAPLANVTFTKVDADTEVPLSGAVFKVIDADGEDVEGFTDLAVETEGTLSITGLPVGDYALVETNAPTGYELSEQERTFAVEAGTTTADIELGNIENEITRGSVSFTKLNDDEEIMAGIEFQLESTELVNAGDDGYSETHQTNEDGVMQVENLRPGTYQFTESYPDGYQHYTGENVTFTIDPVDGETAIDLGEVINYQLVDIDVIKTWQDDDNATGARPNEEGITIELYRETENSSQALVQSEQLTEEHTLDTDDNIWTYTFEGLDAVDADGNLYTYSIEELDVDGYETTIEDFNITNLRADTTSVEGTKTWLDGEDATGDRPGEITVNLLQNGEAIDSQTVEEDTWSYNFTGLAEFDEEGVAYTYRVEEVLDEEVEELYEEISDPESHDLSNRRVGTIDIEGTKTWLDNEDARGDRPEEIEVILYQNGAEEGRQTITVDEDWSYNFTGLAEFDEDGVAYTYTIGEEFDEQAEELYEEISDSENYDLTNRRVGTIDVQGTKTWQDDNNATGDRPEEITVNVLQNGTVIDSKAVEADTDGNWSYSFTDLAEFDDQGVAYDYTVTEQAVPGYQVSIDGYDITNTLSDTLSITINKGWLDDNSEERPEQIEVELFRAVADENLESVDTYTVEAEENWTLEISDLPAFDNTGRAYTYSIEELEVEGYDSIINGFDITNVRVGTTAVSGTKTWLDNATDARPDSITVNLLQDGEEYRDVAVTEADEWSYNFEDLPKYDDQGIEHSYTIEEEAVTGYDATINGYDITNLRVGTIEVEGEKTWLDDNHPDRPTEIEVILYQNAEEEARLTVTTNDDWSYNFSNLPEFDEEGVAYEYTIEEVVPEGYQVSYDDNHNITNTLLRSIEVEKIWLDDEDAAGDRPDEIQIELYQNGTHLPEFDATITSGDNWNYTFEDLPVYDENDELLTYTIEESYESENYRLQEIDGDMTSGFEIINVRLLDIDVTKAWQDDDPNDRPEDITVNLLRNGQTIDTQTITADTNWEYSFTDLEEYDDQDEVYNYTITEHDVPGYQPSINGYDITNTRAEQKDIEVTKAWLDNEAEERPDSITIDLLQNGERYDTVDITAEDDWSYLFEDLAAYDQEGQAFNYTVEEESVEGYVSTINGFDITNLRIGETSIEVTKTWLDNDSEDRPETITVNLLQNGEFYQEAEVTAEEDWIYTFTELPKYDEQGVEMDYTIEEEPVEGYETRVDGLNITNLRTDETAVEVTKEWLDDTTADRPSSIEVVLLQNGESYQETTLTAEDNWTNTFDSLPKYDNQGAAYNYTIEEKPVEGYETTIDGYNITNLRVGTTSVEGNKTWLDNDTEDRPETIEVNLLQNGEEIASQEVSANSDSEWSYIFTNLPTFDEEGVRYTYTVEETELEGYEVSYDGYDMTNLRVGSTTVEGTKSWQDDEEADRPDTITVNLLQNGMVVDTREVTADMEWQYSFVDLAKYDEDGIPYQYTVKEQDVPGYSSTVDGYDITNTRAEQKDIEITKAWLDDEATDRPASITADLMQNGEMYEKVDITAEDGWSYTFEGLPAYDQEGQAFTYTVEEKSVDGYKTTVDGYDITNLRIGTITVEGTKHWENDLPEQRPDHIIVELYQNGNELATKEVTASDDWQYSFTDLPEFDENGVAYHYTISEENVEGYQTEVNGYDLINTSISIEAGADQNDEGTSENTDSDNSEEASTENTNSEASGNTLPNSATNLYNFLLAGIGTLIIGVVLLLVYRRYRSA